MSLYQIVYTRLCKPIISVYLRFNVPYRYNGFRLKIFPGVFHPGFFFSTKALYRFISAMELKNKTFLEVGSGSGLLSLLAYRMGAIVTAIDKDVTAVENTRFNFQNNFASTNASILQSDLFAELGLQKFNFIIINPPYFFKKVEHRHQLAWYCGENGEYFEQLFSGLAAHLEPKADCYMILADNCDVPLIESIAKRHKIYFILAATTKAKWETNYIFKLDVN